MSSPILIQRSIHDFTTLSSLEHALRQEDQIMMDSDSFVAAWKLEDYDAATTVAKVNDPDTEAKRLQNLLAYNILDTRPDYEIQELVREAQGLLQAPLAAVGFMDLGRLWIKAAEGFGDMRECPRHMTICSHTVQRRPECGVLVIKDVLQDARFCHNKAICGTGIRFYAGAQIRSPEGTVLGVLCVCDTNPRPEGLSLREQAAFQSIADCVMATILMG